MVVLVDSNVIVSFLIQSEKTEEAKEILEAVDEPVTLLSVLEEAVYVGLSLIYNCRGFKLREKVRRGLNDSAILFVSSLRPFINEFGVKLIQPPNDPNLFFDAIIAYRLLPNDALIAATCKHYGIRKIATFDEDFKRVEFLEVVEVE